MFVIERKHLTFTFSAFIITYFHLDFVFWIAYNTLWYFRADIVFVKLKLNNYIF